MANGGFYVSVCLLRVVLPLTFIVCLLMRQTALSVFYLLLYFILPLIPLPSFNKLGKCTSCYLQTIIICSSLNFLCQASFQIYLAVDQSYGKFLEPCGFMETLLRHIGFITLNKLEILSAIFMIAPDVIMLIVSVSFFLAIQKTFKSSLNTVDPQNQLALDRQTKEEYPLQKIEFLTSKSKYIAVIFLLLAGALRPSVSSAIYYVVFLGAATWWACYKRLDKTFAVICRIVAVFVAVHITVLLAYQTQVFQEILKPEDAYARYFGLTNLRITQCSDPRVITYNDLEWTSYVNVVALLMLYFILSLQKVNPFGVKDSEDANDKRLVRTLSQRLSQRRLARNPTINWRSGNRKVRGSNSLTTARVKGRTEKTPLISSSSQGTKYHATSIANAPGGDKTSQKENDHIQMKSLQEDYEPPNCMELTIDAIVSIFQLLIRSSYIATNITMMAWSITYHSWVTFVLLLWASIMWMIPNQRRSMLRCSPYIVLYAEFLLIAQYIFGMDLNEEELPTVINGVRLDQIGFYKSPSLPISPILIKTMFTAMFWITMRQFCKENLERKQNNTLFDMSAPLRISATTANASPPQENTAWVKNLGTFVKKLMTKFWIWVVAISLFVIGVTGNRITVFRIVYMALFLFFILTFQISYRAWRRMMYGFWLTVIVYSMCILVMVYTYQFENFPKYWEMYLHIPNELQLDIGLETFQTAELFVRLLAPTFFVVITVVQLHYFHKDFLAISDLRNRGASVSRSGKGSSRSEGSSMQHDESVPQCSDVVADGLPLLGFQKVSFRNVRHLSSTEIKILLNNAKQIFLNSVELIILFLELHMLKIVTFSIMLLCCFNVAASHLILVILCVVATLMGSKAQTTVTLICSIFIAVLLLLTMIYQIQYIQQDMYTSNCSAILPYPDKSIPLIANNSEWLGFRKATKQMPLINLLQGYIAAFAIITSHAVINTRQRIKRQETGRLRPYILFQGINRELADSSISNCLKFLVNYGFYKFGVEISLIATVAVIGLRMDFYGLIYALWLLGLYSLPRTTLSWIWNSFKIFIAVIICLQYLILVGMPPGFCIDYPWYSSEILRRLQTWMFLPDPVQPPSSYKILCDVVLLIIVCRQSLCFRIEKRHRSRDYPGGSNDVIIKDYEIFNFQNPYIDHMTYTKSSLDLLKKGVFSALLWVTLAVTFTAGTSRVNILSIGYLIGSFIFLWQGNDLYLRRIKSILNWWNWLLGYNVIVILIKTVLQIAGCLFMETVQDQACWLVQLLGIGCVSKFGDLSSRRPGTETMQCTIPDNDIGLAWDGLCFSFLLLQRRFFHSYYFFHHIDETKAMTILQSRGAQLMEELRQQQLQEQQSQERKVLEKIRHKMDRIKASQQKVLNSTDKQNHYGEPQAPLAVQSPGVSSSCSPRGYHTPISEEEAPRSLLQAPTPVSAIMTTLDGYLESQRMSFSSPPASELNPRVPSPDESFPVFSPPPYRTMTSNTIRSIAPPLPPAHCPWINVTPRHSIVSQSSHHTFLENADMSSEDFSSRLATKQSSRLRAIRSGDYYMFEDIDDEELDLIKEDEDESSSEGDEVDVKKRFTMSKFLSTALKTDITKAADQALTVEENVPSRMEKGRRASMPASVLRKSSMPRKLRGPSSVLSAPPTAGAHSGSSAPSSIYTRNDKEISRRKSVTLSEAQRREPTSNQPAPHRRGNYPEDATKFIIPKAVKEKITQKFWQSFKVLWAFFESAMVSMIRTLNKISKDYRYVVRVLAQEKRELKENEEFKKGSRSGVSKVWKPEKEVILQLGEIIAVTTPQGSVGRNSPDESTIPMESPKEDKERLNRPALSTITESEDPDIQSDTSERDCLSRTDSFLPDIRIIAPSQERGLDDDFFVYEESESESETGKEEWSAGSSPIWLQLLLATWYAIISHSELVCYFVIFLHQIKSPTFLSLPLPLMVFLWGSLTMPRPTKTFWVTLIAYTEVVVIIKCLFQFEILPWNQTLSPENYPFYPPRIIGVEKKASYASSDLLLLLIIFFHRYMLKSLGLWKSTNEDILSQIESGCNYQELYGNEEAKSSCSREKGFISDEIDKTEAKYPEDNFVDTLEEFKSERNYFDVKSDSYSLMKESVECSEKGKTKLKKKFMCILGEDSDGVYEEKSIYPRYSQATFEKFPDYFNEARAQYCSSTKNFFSQLLDNGFRLSADVYAYMFICDFFNFLVVLFGFSAFGTQQGDGGVSAYLSENKVPVPFLLMMILQFALIVIDRALYLRKYILGKIIFQFVLVIGVHLWMFFILPAITERPFNQLLPPQMWYMVKCFYLLMSAYQIRAGYPARISGNFLCKKYNYINMFSFRGFMAVPFLFELRALMDWIWTDTSMTLSDWLKMEDIFAQIFQLKCQRRAEAEYPLPRGERKSPVSKYLLGGAGLFLIIAIIWFPLVLFALGNTVGESSLPYDVTISLRIGAYQYIYEMSAQTNTIYKYSENQFDSVTNLYKKNRNREAVSFLSNYQFDDVAVAKLSGNSTTVWGISPPDRMLLLQEVESNQTVTIKFSWRVSRVSNNPEVVGVVMGSRQIILPPFIDGERNPKRIELADMLKTSNSSGKPIVIENILPKFLKITNKGNANPISKLMAGDKDNATYRNITISLKTGESSVGTIQQWWEVSEKCSDDNYKNILSKLPINECNLFLTIFTFNDKAFPATLSFISGKGIIGLYVSMVFVMWTLVHGFFTGISTKIMFDDMPNVDRILQLCLDIYLVRESNEFALEEDLFAKLVFLYRSPETIIKWTKERKEQEDEEGGDGSQLQSVEN